MLVLLKSLLYILWLTQEVNNQNNMLPNKSSRLLCRSRTIKIKPVGINVIGDKVLMCLRKVRLANDHHSGRVGDPIGAAGLF